jgi:hypothetical protein
MSAPPKQMLEAKRTAEDSSREHVAVHEPAAGREARRLEQPVRPAQHSLDVFDVRQQRHAVLGGRVACGA